MVDISNNLNTSKDSNSNSINQKMNTYNYLCTQCFKFPYIEFCNDRKHIRLTCSCFNNKKIIIKDLFELNTNFNIISETNLNLKNEIRKWIYMQRA